MEKQQIPLLFMQSCEKSKIISSNELNSLHFRDTSLFVFFLIAVSRGQQRLLSRHDSFSGISQPWHISKRQNTPPLQQASVSPLSFLWHIYWFSKV